MTRCRSPTVTWPLRRSRCARCRPTPTRRRYGAARCWRRTARSRSPGSRTGPPTCAPRFADAFWVDTDDGGHVAIALDKDGRRADALTSNIGHLLGTGVLEPARPTGWRRCCPTRGSTPASGCAPWPPTRPASRGSATTAARCGPTTPPSRCAASRPRVGCEEAARLTRGLVVAAEGVGYRLPELYGGDAAGDVEQPVGLPRRLPAAGVVGGRAAGLPGRPSPDCAPTPASGTLTHPARTSGLLGAWSLRGLRLGEHRLRRPRRAPTGRSPSSSRPPARSTCRSHDPTECLAPGGCCRLT